MAENKKTALIIGAGPAGLTAAYQFLKETDIKPVIIEMENFVGGISRTAEYHGNRMDIGGHRFFTKADEVNKIWFEVMPLQGKPSYDDIKVNTTNKVFSENGPDPEETDVVMLLRNRVSRIYFLKKFFDYPVSLKASTIKNMGFLRTMKAGFSFMKTKFVKKKEINLENFYINRFGKSLYEMFFEEYTTKLWGVHPSKIAADWGAQRVKGISLTKAIKGLFKKSDETSLIEQFYYPKKGPGQLYQEMANIITSKGGEILYNREVKTINLNEDQTSIESVEVLNKETNEVETYKADYFISSMPIKDLIESISNKVDENVYKIATTLPYRDFITVGLLVDKLKIKNNTKTKTLNNIVPDCWIYVQEREVKMGRIQIFNNWSPYMVKDVDNTVWIGLEYFANEGDELWSMPKEDFIKFAIDELVKIQVIDSKDDVLDSTQIKVKKAYPAYFGSYKDFDKVKEYLDKISNLYCVGRNGQHRYNNMDHSMLTSIVCVNDIKNNITDRSNLWNVNTEKVYHEEK